MGKRKKFEGYIGAHGNRWEYRYSIKNKPYRESFATREEAVDFAIAFTAKKRKGRVAKSPNLRMEDLFELVITDLKNNNRRSVADAQARIDLHLKTFFEGMKVKDFRGSDIEYYKRSRLDEEKPPSPASLNRELRLLGKGFNLAYQQELIDFQVSFKGKLLKERNTITRTFSAGEYDTFRSHLTDGGVIGSVDFQREAGWRMPSEVLTLERNQIDFDEESVTLSPYSTKDEKPRVFYFTNRMREILNEQKLRVDALQKKFRRMIPYVFVSDFGKPLFEEYRDKEGIRHVKPSHYFRQQWDHACEESKLYRTTHDLRRTAAVERDNAGLSRTDNMALGGWSTPAMLDRYLQKRKEDLKSAIKKLDSFREQSFTNPSQNANSGTGQNKSNH